MSSPATPRFAVWSAATAAGVVVLIVALLAAGGAPQSTPHGLHGAGLPVSWAVPVLRLLADGAAVLAGGAVLTAAWLLPATDGVLGERALKAVRTPLSRLGSGRWRVSAGWWQRRR